MTCKDCIHHDVCEEDCAFNNVNLDESTFYKNCYHLQNKADFVNVVRCKDCVNGFIHTRKTVLDIYWCDKWKNIIRGCDFCSFGERKEK